MKSFVELSKLDERLKSLIKYWSEKKPKQFSWPNCGPCESAPKTHPKKTILCLLQCSEQAVLAFEQFRGQSWRKIWVKLIAFSECTYQTCGCDEGKARKFEAKPDVRFAENAGFFPKRKKTRHAESSSLSLCCISLSKKYMWL